MDYPTFGTKGLKPEFWYLNHVHASKHTPTKGEFAGQPIWRVRWFSAARALEFVAGTKKDAFTPWRYALHSNGQPILQEGPQSKELAQDYAKRQAATEVRKYLEQKTDEDKPIHVRHALMSIDELYSFYRGHKERKWDSDSSTGVMDAIYFENFKRAMPEIRNLGKLVQTPNICGIATDRFEALVNPRTEGAYAPSYLNKLDGWLDGFVSLLQERHPCYLPADFSKGKADRRKVRGKVNNSRALTFEELDILLRYVEATPTKSGSAQEFRTFYRYAFQFQAGTGLRAGRELLNLTFADVDEDKALIRVKAENAKGKRARWALMTDQGLEAFLYLKMRAGFKAKGETKVLGIAYSTYRQALQTWVKGCFGDALYISSHDLRRSYIQTLVTKLKMLPDEVRRSAGASWTTIEKFYDSELREETAKEAMESSIAYRRFKEAQAADIGSGEGHTNRSSFQAGG